MLTADPIYTVLASVCAHFDGPTADDSGGCSYTLKLAVHASASQHAETASFGAWLALAQVYSQLYIKYARSSPRQQKRQKSCPHRARSK